MAIKNVKSTPDGPAAVEAFLASLEHPHTSAVRTLRLMILGLDKRISEEIKWNAPSFKLQDHFATFKLHPPKGIQLVLHTGAKGRSGAREFKVDDPKGLLKWAASDRCVLTLASAEELKLHSGAVKRILTQWLAQLEL